MSHNHCLSKNHSQIGTAEAKTLPRQMKPIAANEPQRLSGQETYERRATSYVNLFTFLVNIYKTLLQVYVPQKSMVPQNIHRY